jgi:hypothetical protein
MSTGPYFNKSWQRDQYEREQESKEQELIRLGKVFKRPKVLAPIEPRPEYFDKVSHRDAYFKPSTYTSEESRRRREWLRYQKPFKEFAPDHGNWITGFPKR